MGDTAQPATFAEAREALDAYLDERQRQTAIASLAGRSIDAEEAGD